MEKTTHKVKVAGATYNIVSDDTPEYMTALAKEVDLKIDSLLKNSNMSTTQAAVIAALDYADSLKKSDSSTDNIKTQLKESLKDEINAVAAEYREYSGLFEAAIDEVEAINVIELKGLLQEIKEVIEQ